MYLFSYRGWRSTNPGVVFVRNVMDKDFVRPKVKGMVDRGLFLYRYPISIYPSLTAFLTKWLFSYTSVSEVEYQRETDKVFKDVPLCKLNLQFPIHGKVLELRCSEMENFNCMLHVKKH
jgi:hypothetical protein